MDVEQVIREYIDKSLHMSLATVSGNKPWVCEVHFVYDDDLNLYWRSEASRRHSQEIAANSNVAGNIVKQHELGEMPHGIYFEGRAEMLNDPETMTKIAPLFIQRQGTRDTIVEDAQSENGTKFYKVTVENWYAFGKFSGEKVQKHRLEWKGGKR
jgi:uncharacterized protein YhbP (UPF0306 family)